MTREYIVDGDVIISAPLKSKVLGLFRKELKKWYPEFDYDGFEGKDSDGKSCDTLEIDLGTDRVVFSDDISPYDFLKKLRKAAEDYGFVIEGFVRYAEEENVEGSAVPGTDGITVTSYVYAEITDTPCGMMIEYQEEDGCDIDDEDDAITERPGSGNKAADEALGLACAAIREAFEKAGQPLSKEAVAGISDGITTAVESYAKEAEADGHMTTDDVKAYAVPDIMEAVADAAKHYGGHALSEDAFDALTESISNIYCQNMGAFLDGNTLTYGTDS